MAGAMEFRILGSLEVEDGGRQVTPSGRRARSLLALLLLYRNEPVTVDRLVEEIWGDDLPANAAKAVQIQISRLRKLLGEDRLVTVGGGYILRVHDGELDSDRAVSLVESGRRMLEDGDAAGAAARLRDALRLFRGAPLDEFADDAFAQAEAARLRELRLEAAEARIDAELTLGRGAELVGELEALVAEHPWRERLREQLMLALYRGGRQAEALGVYRAARRTFEQELGLEPRAALRDLEHRILNQDPTLDVQRPDPRPVTMRRLIAAAAAGIALLGGLVAVAAWAEDPVGVRPVAVPDSLLLFDRGSGKLTGVARAGRLPTDVVGVGASAWVISQRDGTIAKVDLSSGDVERTVSVRGSPRDVAAGNGAIWVTSSDGGDGLLTKLEPSGDSRAIIPLGRVESFGIVVRREAVWVAGQGGGGRGGVLIRVAPDTASVAATIPLASKPVAIAAAENVVWLFGHLAGAGSSAPANGTIYRVDPRTNEVDPWGAIGFSGAPTAAAAAGDGGVWISTGRDVQRLEPQARRISGAAHVDGRVVDVAVAGDSVWILTPRTITRIDPETMRSTSRVELTPAGRARVLEPTSISVVGGRILVAAGPVTQTVGIGDVRAVPIKARPAVTRIRYGAGSVWSKSLTDPLVSRVDARTNRLVATVDVGAGHGDIAFGHGSVWVTSFDEDLLTRIDPRTNRVLARIKTGLAPVGVAATATAVWVANHHGDPRGSVTRIDPRTNRVVAKIPLGARQFCCGPANMVAAFGDVWVDIPNQAAIVRIDGATNRVLARIRVETGCGQLAADAEAVWFAEGCSSSVLRIDPRTNSIVARIDTGKSPAFPIIVGGKSVWVATNDQRLLQIDRETNAIVGQTDLTLGPPADHPAFFVAYGDGSLWLADTDGGRVLRVMS